MQELLIHLPRYSVKITGEHETEVIRKAAFWLSLPLECPHCGTPLILNYRTPKNFQYYELRCTGTDNIHSINLGQSQNEARDLYFDPKKSWFTIPAAQFQTDRTLSNNPDFTTTTITEHRPKPGTSNSALPDRTTLEATLPTPADRNKLIGLIGECKKAGIDSRLNPADVGALDVIELERQTTRVALLLANAGGRK